MAEAELVGAVLDGRYRVLEPIGHGAMGVVYRGERLQLGRAVAIKVLHDALPNELSGRQRFELEARAMARLEHPHCVAVLDVGLHDGRPYVVMEMVTGESLRQVMDRGRLDIPRALSIMRQVLSGLGHAHELGIVHRDIKPANLILGHKTGLGDQVKILDFGLARSLDSKSARLTTGLVLGTPAYMAPEQCRDASIDARSDLYACGVMLFEMLAGRKPFVSATDDPIEIVNKHLHEPPPRLVDVAPGIEFGALEGVVARALAKDPVDRFPTAQEFAEALDDAARAAPMVEVTEPVPLESPSSMFEPVGAAQAEQVAPEWPAPPSAVSVVSARERRRLQLIAGGVLGTAVFFALVARACTGSSAPTVAGTSDAGLVATMPDTAKPVEQRPADAAVAVAAPDAPAVASSVDARDAPLPDDPVEAALAQANAKVAAKDIDGAIAILTKAHKDFVANPDIPYLTGKLYLQKQRYAEGVASLRTATHLFSGFREDPELIQLVVDAFLATPTRNGDLARFLHDEIGKPAVPLLQAAAGGNPRAAAELRRF